MATKPNEDAIMRALLAQQAAAQGSLAQGAGQINAPAGALADVQRIADTQSQLLQSQGAAQAASAEQQLAAQQQLAQGAVQQIQAQGQAQQAANSQLDRLRQEWQKADLAAKTNLAQEEGRQNLRALQKQIELENLQMQQAAGGGRGGSGGGGSEGFTPWQMYQISRNEETDAAKAAVAQRGYIDEAASNAWDAYTGFRAENDSPGTAWRKTQSLFGKVPEAMQFVKDNAQTFFPPPNKAPAKAGPAKVGQGGVAGLFKALNRNRKSYNS